MRGAEHSSSGAMGHRRGMTSRIPGLTLTEHWFDVPLDWDHPQSADQGGKTIRVFCRELVDPQKEKESMPFLLFLQGGPGFASPRPVAASGWIKRALAEFRVILLDQRGTGLSTPITAAALLLLGTPEQQAQYLRNFRAPSIVKDCEVIRETLLGKDGQWVVLGQSYGGFCLTTYLSLAPSSIKFGLFTGGLPPIKKHPDEVYRATYKRVIERNKRFYGRYPEDVSRVDRIVQYLVSNNVKLPSGGFLSPQRFLQLGIMLGSQSGFEALHYLLEDAFLESEDGLSYHFLRKIESHQASWDTNPIYSVLHESIYNEGCASNWSAERVKTEFPEFQIGGRLGNPDQPLFFTGEMVYPWMFEGAYGELGKLKAVAELVAIDNSWGHLYDIDTLKSSQVPCAAAVYFTDMYVDLEFSLELAKTINCKVFVTNEYQHNGLWEDGEAILTKLLAMCKGTVNIPS